jgi:hypothetical protein
MLLIIVFLTLLTIFLNGITIIPFSIGLLAVFTVVFKKAWIFILAMGLGLFIDLTLIRPLGLTSLIFVIFVSILFLYERKFETQTTVFIFVTTFFGSLILLVIFKYQQALLQSLSSAFGGVLLFRIMLNLSRYLNSLENRSRNKLGMTTEIK